MMAEPSRKDWLPAFRKAILGAPRNLYDRSVFHKVSLVAVLAWIGLGSDGISSSAYGPPEAFLALGQHHALGLFVALLTALTVFIVSSSYSQIIELFPSGGGGYLVASKLLTPTLGMISGCALLVDYVLTIAISIASGVDAFFSFLPDAFLRYRLWTMVLAILVLMVANLRGVRESVIPLVPVFLVFICAHVFAIVYAVGWHLGDFANVVGQAASEVRATTSQLGVLGMLFLIMHSYSMGAGTFTGIEAVSNGLPILRQPQVQTGKRTMKYMWMSLSFLVLGLMVSYLLFHVAAEPGKTLNAVLLGRICAPWGAPWGEAFVIVTLCSEAAILFVAAQTGFLDGPRVLASMALDRWFPTRFSLLSERLVAQNGVLLMTAAALTTVIATQGSVGYLVVLYSINVFITFTFSQSGMVRHWWLARKTFPHWGRKLFINGVGATLTGLILVWVTVAKFHQGGWVTLVVTSGLVLLVSLIRRHYAEDAKEIRRLDSLADTVLKTTPAKAAAPAGDLDPNAKTAVLLVSGFNGLGVHSLLNIIRLFGDAFRNYAFVQVGVIDAGNFKGAGEVENLQEFVKTQAHRYVDLMIRQGYHAEAFTALAPDMAEGFSKVAPEVLKRFPHAVFFGGQLVFAAENPMTRLLHNNYLFAVQRRLYYQGVPFVVLPIRAQTQKKVRGGRFMPASQTGPAERNKL